MTRELDQTLPLQELPVVSYLTKSFLTKLRQGFWFRRLTVFRAVPGRAVILMSNAFEKSITITSDCPPFCISLAKSSTNAISWVSHGWHSRNQEMRQILQPRHLLFNEIIKEEKLSTWPFDGETKLNVLNLRRQCFSKHSIEKMLSRVFLVETHYKQDFSL